MSDLTKTLIKLHGLPEDADEAKVLAAASEAKRNAEKTDTRTLDQLAAAEGKVVLAVSQFEQLARDAAGRAKVETDLATMQFDAAYMTALTTGRIDAKPETKALHESIFKVDRELALKNLASLPEGVVNLTAKGEGGDHSEVSVPAGVDEDSYRLDRRVKARMTANGEDYIVALDAIMRAEAGDEFLA